MNSLTNSINNLMKNHCQQYASNDSGLSWNSNGACESDTKCSPFHDFQCDDLTRSLFINSFGGIEIIQDDDIFSYKSKRELSNGIPNKFRAFSLAKSDTQSNFRNPCSFSSIIHDVEQLSLPNTLTSSPKLTNEYILPNPSMRLVDEIRSETKHDILDKVRPKRMAKKNNAQEYMSSSIKDYQGNKDLNDIVYFIQGSTKSSRAPQQSKLKAAKPPPIKVNACPTTTPEAIEELAVAADSGIVSDNSSPVSQNRCTSNLDADSGTHSSQFVSLNNSDEDSYLLVAEQFQQVLSKKQQKTIACLTKRDNSQWAPSQSKTKCPTANKVKKPAKTKPQTKLKFVTNSLILQSRQHFHQFLSDQYSSFMGQFSTVSSLAT